MSSGSVNGGRKNTGFRWEKKRLDYQKEWELERRDQSHEKMVKEFFELRAKERKARKKNHDRRN
jgi:hypothetical protein